MFGIRISVNGQLRTVQGLRYSTRKSAEAARVRILHAQCKCAGECKCDVRVTRRK